MRRISIFGATGSVGEQTVDLVMRAGGPEAYHTVAVSGGRNIPRLAEIARALRAEIAVTSDPGLLPELHARLAGSGIAVAAGAAALAETASRPVDWVMSAIIGSAGLVPGLKALEQGATLALANKESLVAAGALVMQTAARHKARIIPVDSEHSAVFQALVGEDIAAVETVTLTASGGAFRDWPLEQLAKATVEQASSHPNFAMGQRITIDSATMFNKAMEVIEAKEFFGLAPDQVQVIIQREQAIHALVAYRDGALMAHMGAPDMRHAIGYALNWPERAYLPVARLDLAQIGQLSFAAPDPARYPALALAHVVMETGGLSGAAFNAAKEAALDHFLSGAIGFTEMSLVVEQVLDRLSRVNSLKVVPAGLEDVLAMDHLARRLAAEVAPGLGGGPKG